jgi:beta-mannosidase
MQTTTRTLNTGWRFREAVSRGTSPASDLPWIPAEVPGHVHLDLVRNGVIQHPFQRMAERGCAWVDETNWMYEMTFRLDEVPPHAYLRFNGLDTLAHVWLNGEVLGRTDNMFIPHEFAVGAVNAAEQGKARLCEGLNTIMVLFYSALRGGRARQKGWMEAGNDSLPDVQWNRWSPRSFVRKAQYMYGWDWGPELVSCGIWQSVELVTVTAARILDCKYEAEWRGVGDASLSVDVTVERTRSDVPLTLVVGLDEWDPGGPRYHGGMLGTAKAVVEPGVGPVQVRLVLDLDDVEQWTPNGTAASTDRAAPALYSVGLGLQNSDSEAVDSRTLNVGFRTIELRREMDLDARGESFQFVVNGEPFFIKGANWIPLDSFASREHSTEGRARVEHQIRMCREAGFNMLRVWGGGLYESEHFYDLCDQHGILVWQDFPFACSYYPDTGKFAEDVREEARTAVRRIRNHPCLAFWCGNNENHEMFQNNWTKENRPPRLLGEKLYHEVLPQVVAEEDPKTPYWPSSPYSGVREIDPQSEDFGDRHNWNVWHTKGVTMEGVPPGDWPNYLLDNARFQSEFGFSASCGLTAWDKCLGPEDRWPRSPAVRWHDKTRKDYETYMGYIGLHFPEPQTLEDLVYYSQLNQAEALKCGIEHWRRQKGRCWGTLFWQLNDCWPVQSWSVIDSELEPKAAYYAAKRFYAQVLLSMVREGDLILLHLTNDLLEGIQGDVTVSVESMTGDVLLSETFEALVEANGTAEVGTLDVSAMRGHARDVYVYAKFEPYWELNGGPVENFLFLAEPKELRLQDSGLSVEVTEEQHGSLLTITTVRFAPYVWWRLEGRPMPETSFAQDNFFHLRAGERREIKLPYEERAAELRSQLRLRSL